jgi:phage repressor protein C with HTH and peptisase S24 domain
LVPVAGGNSERLAFSRAWLRANGIAADLAALVRVRGESMTPTIPDGALVLVHAAEKAVAQEGIYAFIRDGAAFIKRLLPLDRQPDGRPGRIMVISDNPSGKSEVIEGDQLLDLTIAGRVRCVLTTL